MPGFAMPRSHGSPSSCSCPSNPFPTVPSASPCLVCHGSARRLWGVHRPGVHLQQPGHSLTSIPDAHHLSQPPSPSQGTVPLSRVSPLQDQEAHQCHDIFLYHPGMPGLWGYFGCQVRDVARAPMGIFRMPGPRCGQSHGEEAAVDAWVATPYLY